jgi:hypothetical protein
MKGESVAVNQEGLQHLFVRQYFNIKSYAQYIIYFTHCLGYSMSFYTFTVLHD